VSQQPEAPGVGAWLAEPCAAFLQNLASIPPSGSVRGKVADSASADGGSERSMIGDSIKVGLMAPLSGVVGLYGEEIVRAGRLACDEVNEAGGMLGRPLELVVSDDGSLPESSVIAADALLDGGCVALIGNLLSNSRIAVAYRVAEPRKVPYLNFSFYEGSILSRYFFHFAALPNQQIDCMIPYMRERFGPRMFFAGNNYEWPRGSIQAAKEAQARCASVAVDEEYFPIGVDAAAIEGLLDRVEAARPDVFVPYFAGADQALLLTRFHHRGLKGHTAVVMGHYDELMASTLAPAVREGLYSSNTYFMTIDTPENRDVLARLQRWPGVDGLWPGGNGILTNFGEGTYICVKAFAEAARAAGRIAAEPLVEALRHVALTAPQGPVRMDPESQHARVNSYLSRCDAEGRFAIVREFGGIDPELPARYRHQRVSQRAVLESDIRLQARMLEQMSEAVILVEAEKGTIIFANAGAERLLGYDDGTLQKQPVTCIDPTGPALGDDSASIIARLRSQGTYREEIQVASRNGRRLWCATSASTFTHPLNGEVWLWVLRDIDTRKRAETALAEQAQHTQAVLDHIVDGILTTDPNGAIQSFNPAAERIFGYAASEVIGRDAATLLWAGAQRLSAGSPAPEAVHTAAGREVEGRRSDGSTFPMELAVSKTRRAGEPLYVWMARDISERKRVERMKNEFVATVSHELRTPLTSIVGSLKLVISGVLGELSPKATQMLSIAHKNAQRLTDLINDLLDIEKLVAGKLQFELKPQPLMPLIQQAIEANRACGSERRVTLTLASGNDDVNVQVDDRRLMQVLSNLLSNAIKYSPADGTVEVTARRSDDAVRVSVRDHGPGVPLAFRSRIFQRFSQADSSDSRMQAGTGLGLAITKELVERMGGRVGFESVENEGATFFFDLPCWNDRLPPPPSEAAGESASMICRGAEDS